MFESGFGLTKNFLVHTAIRVNFKYNFRVRFIYNASAQDSNLNNNNVLLQKQESNKQFQEVYFILLLKMTF